ncbi:MAG: hypothetical protein E7311_04270 [Clostridiales bacterium]|nr:hypothetical protein [Clostridiales bacterium]
MPEKDYIKIAQEIIKQDRGIESPFLIEKEIQEVMEEILSFFKSQISRKCSVIKENKLVYEVKSVYDGSKLNILQYSSYRPKWVEKNNFYVVVKNIKKIFNSIEGYEAETRYEAGNYCLDITLTT